MGDFHIEKPKRRSEGRGGHREAPTVPPARMA